MGAEGASVRWQDQIPDIDRVGWAAVWVHSVEAFNEFETDAARIRAQVRADPGQRATFVAAYDFMLANVPTPREWCRATDTSFCTREQLREYLQAFFDYVVGDRPEPITPPPNDELCAHEKDDQGDCVLRDEPA
jgi:hypothetical protein